MARNEEKALTALNRWTAQKRDLEKATTGSSTYMGGALPGEAQFGAYAAKKRPKLSSEVNTVKECETWRKEILQGVAKKIAEIQNAGLGEHRIRDLNDEINKDLREKGHWEDRIKELGGADYKAMAPATSEVYGAELASHAGYKYFGAAKDLPGVRELFETEAVPEAPRKTRKQLFKNIQPDYYGWRDEEDGMLLLAEQEFELQAVQKEVARWQAESKTKRAKVADATEDVAKAEEEAKPTPAEPAKAEIPTAKAVADFKAYVDVPTMQDIEQLIVRKKKEALLKKYATPDEQRKVQESSDLLKGDGLAPEESA
jgi:pre-mRNA-splicing factor ISY1